MPATVSTAERYPARRALRTTIAVAGPGAIVSSTAIGRNVQTTAAAYPAPMDLTLLPFDRPTETRTFEKGRFEVYEVGPMTLGRATYEPGWRWSSTSGAGGLCQVEHVGLVLSGAAAVKMADGTERVMNAGEFFYVPPGHDSWVVGDEPYVSLHIMGSEGYAAS